MELFQYLNIFFNTDKFNQENTFVSKPKNVYSKIKIPNKFKQYFYF